MKPQNVEDICELSPLQQGMLFHTLLAPGNGMYFEQSGFPLHGPLNIALFERAWQTVLDRHTALRTSFHWDDVNKPLQVVYRDVKLPVEYLDWSGFSADDKQPRLDVFLAEDRQRGFDLSQAPLLRLSVIWLGEEIRYIVFSVHHLLLDGWSSDLIYKEAAALYEAYSRGETLRLPQCRPYGDYIAWLQQQDLPAAEAFWRKRLDGYDGPPQLGIGLPPGPQHQDTTFEVCEARIAQETSIALRQLARQHQLTPNTIVQGAWALLLSRYSGEEDVVFGATVSGRPAELEGVESMVGLFINTLPVRVGVSPDDELLPWLRQLQASQFEARQFEYTPLIEIHAWSNVPRDAPLFETLLAFENFPTRNGEPTESSSAFAFRNFGLTNYPLALGVIPGVEWKLKLIYAYPRFEADAMERLLHHFQQILSAVASDPSCKLSNIALLTKEEREELKDWNDTATNYPCEATIPDLFEEQVRGAPNAVAISFEGISLTYQELHRRANALAHRLRAHNVGPEIVVGVYSENPIDLVTGMLGILKAGGAYLPLDPTYPDQRLQWMLEDSRAAVLVTIRAFAAACPAGVKAVFLEDAASLDGGQPDACGATASNLAYVMYTSGSTGRPKGVEISHRAVIRTVRDTNYIGIGPTDAITQISSFCFDAATFEIWGALLNGGRLVALPRTIALSPDKFASILRTEHITSVFVTTDLFHHLVRERPDVFLGVENILVGGSRLDPKWMAECLRFGRPRRLLHVYGPTESTAFASWYPVDEFAEEERSIPIGSPLANTQLYVLDYALFPVPAGIAGEICIGGDGLARGYLRRPELTAEKFVPDPFSGQPGTRLYRTGDRGRRRADGAIEFVGRFDDQVKIRGFRVEPGEIEAILRDHDRVSEAVVIAREDAPGSKRLSAYLVPADGTLSVADLRRSLEARLPDYMVPSAFVIRDELPLTLNGKIDRKALAAPEERLAPGQAYAAPETPAQIILANIWREVLAVERVGIHDNFFELGGDSIISIQVISRAKEAGLGLTLRQLFQNQTVAQLAGVAGTETGARAEEGTLIGEVPLLPIQCWFFEQQFADPHHFNQSALFEVPAGVDPAFLEKATEHVLAHHDALRLRYRYEDGEWHQFYGALATPVPFRTADVCGVAGSEVQTRIEAIANEAQGSFHLGEGPILRVVYFDLGDRPGRLLFVIHHLAVDSVSWQIIIEDFWRVYKSLVCGDAVKLAAKTSSVRQWATRLHQYAASAKVCDDLSYWIPASTGAVGSLPLDFAGGENVPETGVVNVELDEESTRALLQDVPKAYGTQINDVLLTALSQVLAQWTGETTVRFDLEGHGREPIFEDVDLTRTVGWFTTMFPVRLDISLEEPSEALMAVKEQLRQLPNRGLTYGLLRYLTTDPHLSDTLRNAQVPEVAFNYLGQAEAAPELESVGHERSTRSKRAHLVEINATISGGLLRVYWEYSGRHHRRSTLERVAAEFITRLKKLIAHCRSPKRASFTPSDFAQAGISQKDLNKLVAAVSKTERPV